MNPRVLLVDDDRDLCLLLAAALSARCFDVYWRTSGADALEWLVTSGTDVDVVVADVRMPGMDGLELCQQIVTNHPDVPVMLLTSANDVGTAVAAIRVGASDFLAKPPNVDDLIGAIGRVIADRELARRVVRLRHDGPAPMMEEIVGASTPMIGLCTKIDRVAAFDASVLITGESGTGKELVARALHRRGRRANGPFVALNCAAMPPDLIESELFGHLRGSFTDARSTRAGLFMQANGGILFLDEISELSLDFQAKLLRVLQQHAVRPVGSDVETPCDVRLIAATNGDLGSAIVEGTFREDLYFRINVVPLNVPPLRDRGDDVLLLAQHFLDRYTDQCSKAIAGLSAAVARCLLAYHWPGNVRELENCIEHAVVFARYEEIVVDDLPERVRDPRRTTPTTAAGDLSPLLPLREIERLHVMRAMTATRGNQTAAAQILEIDRKTLQRKLRRYREPTSAHRETETLSSPPGEEFAKLPPDVT